MTLAQAIAHPSGKLVLLATLTAGVHCRAWVLVAGKTYTYSVTVADEVSAVEWTLSGTTTTLTERTSVANVEANAGSWFWESNTLYVRPPSGSLFAGVVMAEVTMRFANHAKQFTDWYEPRISSLPNLSLRIEAVFGKVGQVTGGDLTLINTDRYFDERRDYQWDWGSVQLKVGFDVPGQEMAYADYEAAGVWLLENWKYTMDVFRLSLVERKGKTKLQVPLTFYARSDFPTVDAGAEGSPIPLAYGYCYGVKPVWVDVGLRKFKVAGHRIYAFKQVRFGKRMESITDTTLTNWEFYSGTTYRALLRGNVKNVTYDGTSLDEENAIADCTGTRGTWCAHENYLYVNTPSVGNPITTAVVVASVSEEETRYETANFATTDTANGEFTLGTDWEPGMELAVDFAGKTDDDGDLIENPVEIILDLLKTAGETDWINTSAFTAAAAKLRVGSNAYGEEVHRFALGVYVAERVSLLDLIGKLCKQAGAYVYSDADGKYQVGVSTPSAGEGCSTLEDLDLIDFAIENDVRDSPSALVTRYARRAQDDYDQVEITESDTNSVLHSGMTTTVDELLWFTQQADAQHYNQRVLYSEGPSVQTYALTTMWQGVRYVPGQQIRLASESRDINELLEVIHVTIDFQRKTVKLLAGDRRGLRDRPGYWLSDSAVFPSLLGGGALTWSHSWTDEQVVWARQNAGWWTDDNGFAHTDDARAYNASVWS